MVKALFCGDVKSEFDKLISRLESLNSSQHGPFDVLICTGILFNNYDEYLNVSKNLHFPIPTYFIADFSIQQDLPRNLYVMKASGLQSVNGLVVATCSEDDFPPEDILKIKAPTFRGVDVFISKDWPK